MGFCVHENVHHDPCCGIATACVLCSVNVSARGCGSCVAHGSSCAPRYSSADLGSDYDCRCVFSYVEKKTQIHSLPTCVLNLHEKQEDKNTEGFCLLFAALLTMNIRAGGLAFTLNRIEKRTTWGWRKHLKLRGEGIREKTEMLLLLAPLW